MQLQQIKHGERTAVVLPADLGEILWYIHRRSVRSAKIYEIKFTKADGGYCCEDMVIFAFDAKHGRNLTWCPLHGESWLDAKDQYVPVFGSREEAELALAHQVTEEGEDHV